MILLLICQTTLAGRSRTLTLINNCPHDIWIGASGNPLPPQDTGFQMSPRSTRPLVVPGSWQAGRIWARTGCAWRTDVSWGPNPRFVCQTGDCGAGSNGFGVQCKGIGGQPPATLAEFTLIPPETAPFVDFYDLSNVDGYNVPLKIESVNGEKLPNFDPRFNCGNPGCRIDVNRCPEETTLFVDGKKYCMNLCLAVRKPDLRAQKPFLQRIFNDPKMLATVCCDCWEKTDPPGCAQQKCGPGNCCGCFNPASLACCSPYDFMLPKPHGGVCRVEEWPKVESGYYRGKQFNTVFKDQCPDAYSWQFDDLNSTYQCKNSDYRITFC